MRYTISARLSKKSLLQHLITTGGSGSGKTTLFLNMFYDMVRTSNKAKFREALLLLEPHGDFSLKAGLIRIIPRERLVFISNAISRLAGTDKKYTFTFNPFENDGSDLMKYTLRHELTHAITELLASSEHSTQMGISVQMATALSNAIAVTLESPEPNILTLKRVFSSNNEDLLRIGSSFPHPEVAGFMRDTFMSDAYRQTRSSVLTKLSYFLSDEQTYQILGSTKSTLQLDKFIDEGKVIIIHNPKGVSANVQSFVGRLIVARVFSCMLRREAIPVVARRPLFVFIDEVHNYLTASLAHSLQEARKYSMGLLMAIQSWKQISDTKMVNSMLTNTHYKISGIVDGDSIAAISKSMNVDASLFSSLEPLQFVIKKMGNSEAFKFTTRHLPDALFYTDAEAQELYRYLLRDSGLYIPTPTLTAPPPAPPRPDKTEKKKAKPNDNDNLFGGTEPAFKS